MKKLTKLALGVTTALSLATVLKKYQDDKFKTVVNTSLKNAKALVNDENITGTWIDMTPVWSQEVEAYALVGGVMTKDSMYDFIAHHKTGNILFFTKQ